MKNGFCREEENRRVGWLFCWDLSLLERIQAKQEMVAATQTEYITWTRHKAEQCYDADQGGSAAGSQVETFVSFLSFSEVSDRKTNSSHKNVRKTVWSTYCSHFTSGGQIEPSEANIKQSALRSGNNTQSGKYSDIIGMFNFLAYIKADLKYIIV